MDSDDEISAFAPSPSRRRSGLPLGFRVIVAVVALLTLLVAVAVVAIVLLAGVDHAARAGEHATPYGNAVSTAALNAKGVANDERGFLLTGKQDFVNEASRRIRAAQSAFVSAVDAAQTPIERTTMARAHGQFIRWVEGVRTGFARFKAGDRADAVAASVGPNRALRKLYESTLARAQELAVSAEQSSASSLSDRSNDSLWVLLVCLGVALATAIPIGLWLVRSIAVPVYRLLSILNFDGASGMPSL